MTRLFLFAVILLFFSCTSTIHESIRDGNISSVRSYLKSGKNLHEKVPAGVYKRKGDVVIASGMTPLEVAVESGRYGIVKLLIDSGADVNVLRHNSYTLLMMGLGNPDVRITRLLISKGVDVNRRGLSGNTALMYHCRFGNVEVCRALIKAGADVKVTGGALCKNLMGVAVNARKNRKEMVSLLLESELRIDAWFGRGMRAIHFAESDTIPFLVKKGADINARNDYGITPFLWRSSQKIIKNNVEHMRSLVKSGADINALSKMGWNAMHFAAYSGDLEIIKFLRKLNVSAGHRDKEGNSSMHIAYIFGRSSKIRDALLGAGANPYIKNNRGLLPRQMKKRRRNLVFY